MDKAVALTDRNDHVRSLHILLEPLLDVSVHCPLSTQRVQVGDTAPPCNQVRARYDRRKTGHLGFC